MLGEQGGILEMPNNYTDHPLFKEVICAHFRDKMKIRKTGIAGHFASNQIDTGILRRPDCAAQFSFIRSWISQLYKMLKWIFGKSFLSLFYFNVPKFEHVTFWPDNSGAKLLI